MGSPSRKLDRHDWGRTLYHASIVGFSAAACVVLQQLGFLENVDIDRVIDVLSNIPPDVEGFGQLDIDRIADTVGNSDLGSAASPDVIDGGDRSPIPPDLKVVDGIPPIWIMWIISTIIDLSFRWFSNNNTR